MNEKFASTQLDFDILEDFLDRIKEISRTQSGREIAVTTLRFSTPDVISIDRRLRHGPALFHQGSTMNGDDIYLLASELADIVKSHEESGKWLKVYVGLELEGEDFKPLLILYESSPSFGCVKGFEMNEDRLTLNAFYVRSGNQEEIISIPEQQISVFASDLHDLMRRPEVFRAYFRACRLYSPEKGFEITVGNCIDGVFCFERNILSL